MEFVKLNYNKPYTWHMGSIYSISMGASISWEDTYPNHKQDSTKGWNPNSVVEHVLRYTTIEIEPQTRSNTS